MSAGAASAGGASAAGAGQASEVVSPTPEEARELMNEPNRRRLVVENCAVSLIKLVSADDGVLAAVEAAVPSSAWDGSPMGAGDTKANFFRCVRAGISAQRARDAGRWDDFNEEDYVTSPPYPAARGLADAAIGWADSAGPAHHAAAKGIRDAAVALKGAVGAAEAADAKCAAFFEWARDKVTLSPRRGSDSE